MRGVHVRVGLVGDELVVHQRRPHALGAVTPAQHVQELLLEVLRVLFFENKAKKKKND